LPYSSKVASFSPCMVEVETPRPGEVSTAIPVKKTAAYKVRPRSTL
jgi:hypothetical protein